MGVYVFECLHAPYIKVGHHLQRRGRTNPYYRIAGRGFQSVVHPEELDGLLYEPHLRLVAWFPNLTREDEREIHTAFKTGKIGEFHRKEDENDVLRILDSKGERKDVSLRSKKRAMQWGTRKVLKAKRKKKKREGGC